LRAHDCRCGYFKDDASETIDRFTEALEKMVSLKRFHHAIEGCTCILDNGLSGLYQTLSHLSLLESIKINCGNCPQVSDEHIQNIVILAQLPKLQEISLNLKG